MGIQIVIVNMVGDSIILLAVSKFTKLMPATLQHTNNNNDTVQL